ncbi:MAG: HlyD family secretion protein [Flammeovirgaceae bacterium]
MATEHTLTDSLTKDLDVKKNGTEAQEKPVRKLKEEDINIRSDDVKEVLGKAPPWLIRFGILLIFIVVGIVLLIAYVIKYPDTVETQVTIVTKRLPVSVKSARGGQIDQFFVEDGQLVESGTHLLAIDDKARYQDMMTLKKALIPFRKTLFNEDRVMAMPVDFNLQLGSAKDSYVQFIKRYQEYFEFLKKRELTEKQIAQFKQQIATEQAMQQIFVEKKELQVETFDLTKKNYEDNKKLFEQDVISEIDFENAKKNLLSGKLNITGLKEQELKQGQQIQSLEERISNTLQRDMEEHFRKLEQLKTVTMRMEEQIDRWESEYVLTAPIDGKVAFYKYWSENQDVKSGDEVLMVLPESDEIFAFAYLDAKSAGKVAIGQYVKIELQAFPSKEFGNIFGIIEYRSVIAKDDKYFLRLRLPNGLKTNYGNTLEFTQEMKGDGKIVTEDLRLIQRFIHDMNGMLAKVQ